MLTELAARKAEKRDKAYKKADSGGLFLFVMPSGTKSWRMKYRYEGKEQLLTFGLYPEVSISEARERRDSARRQLRDGADPLLIKRLRTAGAEVGEGNTFESVARLAQSKSYTTAARICRVAGRSLTSGAT